MYAELWIALYHQMHMIGHDFQTQHLCLMFITYLMDDMLEPFCYLLDEDLTPVFRTPDDVILAGVIHIPI
jgi:hypothetical protein